MRTSFAHVHISTSHHHRNIMEHCTDNTKTSMSEFEEIKCCLQFMCFWTRHLLLKIMVNCSYLKIINFDDLYKDYVMELLAILTISNLDRSSYITINFILFECI